MFPHHSISRASTNHSQPVLSAFHLTSQPKIRDLQATFQNITVFNIIRTEIQQTIFRFHVSVTNVEAVQKA